MEALSDVMIVFSHEFASDGEEVPRIGRIALLHLTEKVRKVVEIVSCSLT